MYTLTTDTPAYTKHTCAHCDTPVHVKHTCICVHSMPRAGNVMRRRDIDSGHSRDIVILSSCSDADDIDDRWLNVRLTNKHQQHFLVFSLLHSDVCSQCHNLKSFMFCAAYTGNTM